MVALVIGLLAVSVGVLTTRVTAPPTADPTGLAKIDHIVVIMQENRSFDSYFGTFPGADGIPMVAGRPAACVPNPIAKTCDFPYHVTKDTNSGGPHGQENYLADL
ncbi:MAG TPA: alkaline phosphatase family protein, partial [Acidimicrobiales bacterium]